MTDTNASSGASILDVLVKGISYGLMLVPGADRVVLSLLRPVSRLPLISSIWWRLRLHISACAKSARNPLRWVRIPGSGQKLLVNIGSQFGCLYFDRALYEEPTTEFLMNNLGEGAVFLDIGANCGYFTVLAADRIGNSGRVFSFEPNPAEMRGLESSIRRNGTEGRVARSGIALSDTDMDETDFFVGTSTADSALSSLSPWSGHLESGNLSEDSTIKVTVRKLDSIAAELGIERIDVVKIDVEGVEMSVLKGMEDTLKRTLPKYIICETGEDGNVSAFLRGLGYEAAPLQYHSEADRWGNMVFTLQKSQ